MTSTKENESSSVVVLSLGAIEIKGDKCFVDGKPTRNPVLIGLALLDFLEHNSEHPKFQETFEFLTNYIKENNLRNTYERKEILKAIFDLKDPFSSDDLFLCMENRKRPLCRASIYNAINLFVDAKIIVKAKIPVDGKYYVSWFKLNPKIIDHE